MTPERDNYQALLESLADGVEVDWAALDAQAATNAERTRYRNLRLVARVAELHRTLVLDDEDVSVVPHDVGDAVSTDDPTTWGHLSVISRLASGAFGRIYRAHDSQLNRDVALKLLRGDIGTFRPIERLLAEARTLAKLRHSNVVTVYGADVRDGRAGLWMELVDGQTLEAWLRTHGPMGSGEATAIGIDLCRALAAVHGSGLVHGDVKAQNVMREHGGRIVLMDFGAGRAQGADATGVAGTPMYLASEVLAGEPPTPRSDLYSLGVLLFHLLTAEYPRTGADLDGLRAAHADGARTWLRDLRSDLPDGLVHTIERAIDADPARRFVSAGEMERALREALDAPGRAAEVVPARTAIVTTSVNPVPRFTFGFAIGALALLIVVVGLIVWSRTVDSNRGTVLSGIRTIGVLPMRDLTGSAVPAHFVDGLTDELISTLGQIHALTVKTAFSPEKDSDTSPGEIARALDVDALLETTLSTPGGGGGDTPRVKVRARLVAAGTQGVVWSQEFDRQRGDSRALTNAIAGAIARAVNAVVTPMESARLTSVRQTIPAAEEAYLLGRTHLDQYGAGSADLALKAFSRALQLDSGHAGAHAGAARAYVLLGMTGTISQPQARGEAWREVRSALDLDPDLAEAHATLANIRFLYDWDWSGAEREFLRSLELNANSGYARTFYADFLAARRRFDESLLQAETAKRLDPESGAVARRYALFLYYKHDFAAAERALRDATAIEPNNAGLPVLEGRIAEARGFFTNALEATGRAAQLSGGGGVPLRVQEIRQQALAGRREEALAGFLALQRESASRTIRLSARDLAYIQLALGNTDQAVEWFSQSVSDRDPTVVWLGIDPRLEALQHNERFRQLLRAIGLPVVP
jgi:eukaryotic-like serine/threonine-protein kinase